MILPIIGKEIEIIADDSVDKKFGTGAVKVTPAHDPDDFEIDPKDGKANLKGGQDEGGKFVKIIEAESVDKAMQSVDVCPAAVITVQKIED